MCGYIYIVGRQAKRNMDKRSERKNGWKWNLRIRILRSERIGGVSSSRVPGEVESLFVG